MEHDSSLILAKQSLVQDENLIFHPDPSKLPFHALLHLARVPILDNGRALSSETVIRVGVELHKGRIGRLMKLTKAALWRLPFVEKREGEAIQTLYLMSGTPLCYGKEVIGFQNYELLISKSDADGQTEDEVL